jgi:transcriptional regulator with XRE-family HTH domain
VVSRKNSQAQLARKLAADGGKDDDQRLGARIRALRVQQNLKLAVLSQRCGLSIGQLSEIERGLSAPSVRSLRLISEALSTPVAHFFEVSDELNDRNSEQYVRRRANRPTLRLTPTGVIKTLLVPEGPGILELYEISVMTGGTSGGEIQAGPGEKAGVVLSGRARLWLADASLDLGVGDSFRFPADLSHALENPFDVPTTLLWAVVRTDQSRPA